MQFYERCEELEQLRKIFVELDRDNNGLISLEEIQKGLNKVMGHLKGNLKEFEELLIALDKNCNGVVDYSEFLTAAVSKQRLLSMENLKLAFKVFDSDGSGYLSEEEIRAIFESNGSKKDEDLWK